MGATEATPSGKEQPDTVRLGASVLGARGHICAFFNSREEEYRVLLPFIREGLEHGDRAFHIVDPERETSHRDRLRKGGIDVREAEARGQMEIRDWNRAHLDGGRFDRDRMLELAARALAFGREHGFAHTRFVTHMEWALTPGPTLEELVEYEARANLSVPRDGDPVVCVYDMARWGGHALVDILRTHPLAVIGGMLYENPFYVPPEEFLLELHERPSSRSM